MSDTAAEEFDVIVVGGGPGGSTTAGLVAKAGHRVLLLEKEHFPRYQIGESLIPATIHGICGLLGVADEIDAQGFTPKAGGTFRWGSSPDPWSFVFALSPKLAGPSSRAYQVERSKFDEILLRHSARLGVDVREGCTVTKVLESDDRVSGVVYTDPDGRTRTAHARHVVDASGHRSRTNTAVGGERMYSKFFQNIAVFGYFEGGERLPYPRRGNIFCEAFEDGWFWYIPLTDDLTSVGAVVNRDKAAEVQGDRPTALEKLIAKAPHVSGMLANAKRVTDGIYGEVRVRKDYSYLHSRFWKPGMVLVGDAACFIDPVFSSGVHLATYSALLAARSINSALEGELDEATCFAEFEKRYRREYSVFYEFLMSFYQTHSDENSYYWSAKKVRQTSDDELECFINLVGGAASGDASIGNTDATRERLEKAASALDSGANAVSANGGDDALPLYKSEAIGNLMDQGVEVQAMAEFGDAFEAADPLFEGGLISSSDALRWVRPAG
ncbi:MULTISPECIES: FAD-dependent oxidoreductase [unclassified Streptomyces]|uniref:FAD-dependent oxidoreductase n=1 Tax=unclassified Streptomyces TaxID=2593676 RepID=UPI0036E6C09C